LFDEVNHLAPVAQNSLQKGGCENVHCHVAICSGIDWTGNLAGIPHLIMGTADTAAGSASQKSRAIEQAFCLPVHEMSH
jgi:hypothetical protein